MHDDGQRPGYLRGKRHHCSTDLFEKITPGVVQLTQRAECRLRGTFGESFIVLEDEVHCLAVLQLLDGQFLQFRDAFTQFAGQTAEGLGEILHGAVERHSRSGGQLRRGFDHSADLFLGHSQRSQIGLLSDDHLVAQHGARLQFGRLRDKPLLDVRAPLECREQTLLGLLLRIGILQCHGPECGKRRREFHGEGLAERGQPLFERAEVAFDLLRLLLELVGVGSDLDKEVGDSSGHGGSMVCVE